MEENRPAPETAENGCDIFLCTRELPDALTAETAALRQLCSALAGDGYRVFFPSALPKELSDEERASRIVEALQTARVMVAAGVGDEGADDPVAVKLRSAFLARAKEDPSRRMFVCWRDAGRALSPELEGMDVLDMSDLSFLVTLKEQLAAALTPPAEAEEETAAPEEAPAAEAAPGPEEAPKKAFPWKWLLLGAVVIGVIVYLLIKK